MQWLWLLMRCLFPRDPVKQAAEAARQCVAKLVAIVATDEALESLRQCEQSRAYVEAIANDYEASVHFAIAMRACQIAGIAFRSAARPFHQPSKPKSLAELLARIEALAKLCADIERLAQLRAIELRRQHEANPLEAVRTSCGPLRHASHATSPGFAGGGRRTSSLAEGGGGGSRALARETEGAARSADAAARAPPVFDASPYLNLDSEARLLRPHPHARNGATPCWPSETPA